MSPESHADKKVEREQVEDVTTAPNLVTADEMLHVDEKSASALKRDLETSHQSGFVPQGEEEKRFNRRLNRKLDLMILPLVALGYMFNQLDRSNLGNAQSAGFSTDLGLPSDAVNNASSLFYVTYVPLQPFAAALGRRVGAPRFMGVSLILWGALTIAHAFIKTEGQLIAVRLLMGLAECGFYPSVIAYISDFYPRFECGFRFGLFYGFFSVAGAFGGLLAYGILQVKGALLGWQYLFIIEGVVPVVLGLIIPFWLADNIKSAWYLSDEERNFAARRMAIDSASNMHDSHQVTRQDFIQAFRDWRVWATVISNILASISSQGFTLFFPVVVKGLGYDTGAIASLMTVPPYVLGAIGVWLFAWSSDRFHERTYHLVVGLGIVIVGLILTIVIPLDNAAGRYGGLLVLLFGGFIHTPLAVAWLSGNTPEPGKRSVAIGISAYSNLAGIIGAQLYRSEYGPGYILPLKVTVGIIAAALVGFAMTSVGLRFVNTSRAKKIRDMSAAELEEENRGGPRIGDKKWTFVYGL
ncbi:major facilitator superfamily transporter [Xylariaceae sp. FL1272]|nr:major facilitator superfamily transporter [Xylariaceae sp. FL1272]